MDTRTDESPRRTGPERGDRRRSTGRSRPLARIGWALVAAGIVAGGWGVYELVVTDVIAESDRAEVTEQWRTEQGPVAEGVGTEHREDFPVIGGAGQGGAGQGSAGQGGAGQGSTGQGSSGAPEDRDPLGLLHVPRWDGGDEPYTVPIGASSDEAVLDRGQVGHYVQTQRIGEVGNAGLSGHRTTHGKPLREVHRLEDGDAIVVESEDAWLVYRVVARDIVKPHETEVLDPVPPFEAASQDGRYLTLTTCDPIYGITERYIVWAEADYWTPKSEGLPPALA